jgi:hypothetical protein
VLQALRRELSPNRLGRFRKNALTADLYGDNLKSYVRNVWAVASTGFVAMAETGCISA